MEIENSYSISKLNEDKFNTSSYGEIKIPKDCIAIELDDITEIIQINKKMTYGLIKKILIEKKISLKKLQLFDKNDKLLNDNDSAYTSIGTTILGKILDSLFSIKIQDLDQIFSIEKMKSNTSIKEVQQLLEIEQHKYLDTFSYKGIQLSIHDKLLEKEIGSNALLISKITVIIVDTKCDLIEEINAYDFWTLEILIKTYCESQRREIHETSKIIFNNKVLQNKNLTLYMLQIRHNSKLQYFVPPFKVLIQDNEDLSKNENNIILEIQDQWDINQLMASYSRITSKPFMDEDKIMLNGHILEGGIPIWRLRIGIGTKLVIGREMQVRALPYLCSDCGIEILLKNQDAVQCRNCFGKILYKKRTRRACQYDCR